MKFHRKDIVIDAEQWKPGMNHPEVSEYTIKRADGTQEIYGSVTKYEYDAGDFGTDGVFVSEGDWIITGSIGEIWTMRDKAFKESFSEIPPIVNQVPLEIAYDMFVHYFDTIGNRIYETAVSKGWWEEDRNNGEMICLAHSELSEALEALRKDPLEKDAKVPSHYNVEVELADCIIRIMDMSFARKYDVAGALVAKMRYNESRPYKHGGKKF